MRFWWRLGKVIIRTFAAPTWQIRPAGWTNVPPTGGVLLAANHQSFLDPPLVAACLDREVHIMARSSLFEIPILGPIIVACNGYPIERESRDVKGVNSTIERLRGGNALLMFPEGTRTRDGGFGPVKKGVRILAERAAVPVIPVLIDGAFRLWPKGRALPGLRGRIDVVFGPLRGVGSESDLEGRIRADWMDMKSRLDAGRRRAQEEI